VPLRLSPTSRRSKSRAAPPLKSTGWRCREVHEASQRWANPSKRSLDEQLQPSRDSGLIDSGHVLVVNDTVYNAVLTMSDVMQGTNSFYKLQVIELDKGNGWCVNNGTRSPLPLQVEPLIAFSSALMFSLVTGTSSGRGAVSERRTLAEARRSALDRASRPSPVCTELLEKCC